MTTTMDDADDYEQVEADKKYSKPHFDGDDDDDEMMMCASKVRNDTMCVYLPASFVFFRLIFISTNESTD